MSKRTSSIGKLYDTCQGNKHLDKIVTEAYWQLEFEIQSGYSLPITLESYTTVKLSETDVAYVLNNLKVRGVVAKVDDNPSNKNFSIIVEELL